MSDYFTLGAGHVVAEMDFQPGSVNGVGGVGWPVLTVMVNFTFRSPKGLGTHIDFRELRCRVSPFDGNYVAASFPSHIGVRIKPGEVVNNQAVFLEIPIDRERLALIERLRKGGDVKMRLDCELFADELVEISRTQDRLRPSIMGLVQRNRLLARPNVFIARSEWVERILPGMEFGKIHIVELPAIPIEACAGMQAAFEALQQAQKLERQGFYEEAISKCRVALEPFWEPADKPDGKGGITKIKKLKASWETRLGQETYDWLNSSFGVVRGATNKSHHVSSSSFGQLEAQMLLMITTALIAYAMKTAQEAKS